MKFLFFENWMWALVALPILLFYLVRIAGRRQEVSAYVLWQRALARRSAWSRHWQWCVSLVVALLFVGLVAVALLGPLWPGAMEGARSVVLVIDTSASMNTTDIAPSRLARAQAHARNIVDRLGPFEQAAVITAGTRVDVLCGFTLDRRQMVGALEAVSASEGSTRVDQAVRLARRMVASQRNPQIIVVSDGAFESAEELARADDVHLVVVAGEARNVAITRLAARPSFAGGGGSCEVLVEVANFGAQPVEAQLTVRNTAAPSLWSPVAVRNTPTLQIPAGSQVSHVVSMVSTGAGLIAAELDIQDDLVADNRAQLLVPWVGPQPLVIASEDSPVFAALSELRDSAVARAEVAPEDLTAATVTVFHGRVPEQLPPGPTLIVEPDGQCDLWELDETGADTSEVVLPVSHASETPLLAQVDLSRVVFEEVIPLQIAGHVEPLVIDSAGRPLYLLVRRAEGLGPVLVLTARLTKNRSDLTMRPDFPILLANAVRWLSGSGAAVREATSTSDVIRLAPSPEPRDLLSPDARSVDVPAEQDRVGPLTRGGVWTVEAGNGRSGEQTPKGPAEQPTGGASGTATASVIAVSLVDAAESDVRPRVAATRLPDELLGGGPGLPLWTWLVVLAVLVTLVEWYLYHCRILI